MKKIYLHPEMICHEFDKEEILTDIINSSPTSVLNPESEFENAGGWWN